MLIKNFDSLASTPERKDILQIVESGLESLQPDVVLKKNLSLSGSILKIQSTEYDLGKFRRIYLVGFGKGSAKNSALIEELLGDYLTAGFVIDVIDQNFQKIHFTKGTHPLISEDNVAFTKKAVQTFTDEQLSVEDLVIVVICGGGSAMFEVPHSITFDQKRAVDDVLLHCGANIKEMNVIRKHLSYVKGGGFAKVLYPATIATLVFSDVPGNNLSTIASGPTVKDDTSLEDVKEIIQKYPQLSALNLRESHFHETPKDDKYFENVATYIVLSNITALEAMKTTAQSLGYQVTVLSDQYQNDANLAAQELSMKTKPGEVLLTAGETTVKVTGHGQGGRNQQLALASLEYLGDDVVLVSIGTDGWDNSHNAGGIADQHTKKKSQVLGLSAEKYLSENNSLEYLEKVGDAITTGKLPSNVADLIVILHKKPDDSVSKKSTPSHRFMIPELHDDKLLFLEKKANHIRELIISSLLEAGSGHSAGPLGMSDIFACLYFHILNIDPKNPTDPNRDRLVLSNGHICPVQYATLALAGFFPVEELKTLRKINSRLQGHPHRGALPGIENTSGPLGEGLSQAIGMALAARLDKLSYQVYVIMGDGEQNEGNVWEAAMLAAKYKLHNLTAIIDRNNIQIDGFTETVMPLEALRAKYEAFGWNVLEVDGHNYRAFIDAIREANSIYEKPTCIIAHTIPGRGVDFMEEDFTWHGKPPNAEEAKKALDQLRTLRGRIESEHK